MEQKSKIIKRKTKKDSSKAHHTEINHKESPRQKRKLEQKEEINKKIKMDNKGKQKAEDKPSSKTSMYKDDIFDEADIDNNEETQEHEDDDDDDDDQEVEEEEDQDEEAEDEDDEDMDEDSELSRVRRTLGLQMQGLFGGIMSSDFGKFKTILANLRNNDDPTMQLIALQELADILAVSSEDNLAGFFSTDSFSKELVRIMKGSDDILPEGSADMDEDMMLALAMSEGFSGGNPEVMLLACRCIFNLLEAMPTAVTSVVSHGAIKVLCQKLKSIQYIDLAEQALYALEKIAAQLPRAVVHEGGLSAALMYFDFFGIHAQRTALKTAANCMRGIDADSFPQVLEITPTLMNTISYSDRNVVELTCLCWVRISESYRSNRECLERAITADLLKTLYKLVPISGNANAVHPAAFQDILRIFRSISKASPQLSFELLKLGIMEAFYQILTGSSSVPDSNTPSTHHHQHFNSKWRDSVPTILKIIVDLLPPLPKDGMFSSRRFKSTSSPIAGRTRSSSSAAAADNNIDPRVEWLHENPENLQQIDHILIPLTIDLYASTVNLRVRQLVTHTLVKLLHFSDADTLLKVLKNVSLSSFFSGILTRQEHPVLLIDALYSTELLIKKLPEVYLSLFEREGVLHEIDNLSKLPLTDDSQAQKEQSQQSTQGNEDTNNTTVDESDGNTTDADKKDSQKKDESNEESDGETSTSNKADNRSSLEASSSRSPHRKLFEGGDFQSMLRSHQLLHQQYRLSRHHHYLENEKGVGRGSTRKYIIQLAQYFIKHYVKTTEDGTLAGNGFKEISQFTKDIMSPDCSSEKTLLQLSTYLRDSSMGISSFELINTGLMKALLAYLTDETSFKVPLDERKQIFKRIFMENPDIDQENSNSLKKLVVRLQEILSRSEAFEVVTPLESSSTDSLRNPTSMLAKQLRLRLTGKGDDVPSSYKQLMVSTHAVATFRVLEEYLLARISASSAMDDDEDEDEEVDVDEEDHLLIEEEINDNDAMDVDEEEEEEEKEPESDENQDAEMSEADKEKKQPSSSSQDTASSSSKKEKKDGEWKIRFSLNGSVISNDSTVYAAVHQYEQNPETRTQSGSVASIISQSSLGRNIWSSSYPVTYERVWVSNAESSEEEAKKASSGTVRQLADISLPRELESNSNCYEALQLLKALSVTLDMNVNGISAQDFINRKLTAKANRQLEEPLIVASSCLPTWIYWLMSETPFLFPFETRYLFIQSTSFGYARLIARWQSLQMRNNTQNGTRTDSSDSQQPVLGRMERQKVRIMRNQMLESAVKILDLFGSSPTVLEIEYMGEEGTGMGPTLEFYASTSKEFCKSSLNMWRGSVKGDKGYVDAPQGLFPKSLTKLGSRSSKKVINLFKTLGQFVAKGLLDFRIIDIPFSAAFFKVALDHVAPSPELLMEIDPQLAKSINMLQSYIQQKRDIYADTSKSSEEKMQAIKHINVDGAKIEDLCLDFTLPGDDTYELKPGGSEISVTINNVEEYIDLVQDKIAGSGIAQQIAAFREGFNGLFAIDDLKLLTHHELVSLFGKADEDWSYATLSDTIRADHGFTMESEPVQNLLHILADFSDVEKRQFLQFTTGSPRLPIGGWKSLRPVFTVVRKMPEGTLTADDYLPSVMTCANYLKMPAYTTKKIMQEKLKTSMNEGQNSFLLS